MATSDAGVNRRALIVGISGQDGAYLARLLVAKGYRVSGTSRIASKASRANLDALGISGQVDLVAVSPRDAGAIRNAVESLKPDEIYYLAGQSSVARSFESPEETISSITIGCVNTLEAVRLSGRPIRLYNAGSGDCFGNTADGPAFERTAFRPLSPYAVAKVASIWETAIYRDIHGLHACSGLMFNHESPLRSESFVTQKIVAAAGRIAAGGRERLQLGNIRVKRDWGWAPDYVEAMWLMLQQDVARDYVVATGKSCYLEDFVRECFSSFGLEWREHVDVDAGNSRRSDVVISEADPSLAAAVLGWKARHDMSQVVQMMLEARPHAATGGSSVAGYRAL